MIPNTILPVKNIRTARTPVDTTPRSKEVQIKQEAKVLTTTIHIEAMTKAERN
jgi:hypothetical protein